MVAVKWISEIRKIKEKRLYNLVTKIRDNMIKITHHMRCPIYLQWVKAHDDTIGNEYADYIANAAVHNIKTNYIDKNTETQNNFRDINKSFIINNWSATSAKMDKNKLKKTWENIWTNVVKHEMEKKK
eukprot:28865_1